MAHKFVVGIRGKIPYLIEGDECIVTDNDDYTLELVPDGEWEPFVAKTVLYIYDNGKCILHPIEGNEDTIPVIEHSGRLHIGVTAGEIRTTTWVTIPIKSSARRKGRVQIPEPEPEVYDQIMDAVNEAVTSGISSITRTNSISTTGETVYYLQVNRRNGTFYNIELPQTPNALRLEIGEPTSSDKGAGANNSPFWYDKQSGYLWHYAGQYPMDVEDAMWQQVRGRPQVTSGEGAPTTSTVGEKDDLYVDSTTKYLYWCSGWEWNTYQPGTKKYIWVQLTTTTTSGGSGDDSDSGSGDSGGSAGTPVLKAVYDEDTGELTVSGGTVAFDEETGELTVSGSPLSIDEETGEMSIGG